MTWRSAVVYWVLAVVVGVNLYVTWLHRRPVAELPEQRPGVMVDASAAMIDRISIGLSSGRVLLQRIDGRWVVQEPAGLDVSSDLVDALVDSVTTIPPVEEFSGDEDASPGQFGLDKPVAVLELASGPVALATVEFGSRNPTRTAAYARLAGEPRLYLMGLNALYYIELVEEEVDRQRAAGR